MVLLSHPDLNHIGALPYAMSKLGMKADVFGTIPLFKMGRIHYYHIYFFIFYLLFLIFCFIFLKVN